jgi:hypothetical protein
MSIWQEEKGSRVEVVDGSLVFFDRKANATPYGKVLVDAPPVEAAGQLKSMLSAEPAGEFTAFFEKRPWGDVGALVECIPVGSSQLLVLFSPAPRYWYSREFTRVLLVETSLGAELPRRLQIETGSDNLQAKRMNGCWVHYADLGKELVAGAAWHGRSFASTVNPQSDPEEFVVQPCPSFQAAADELGRWIVGQLRLGHPVLRAAVSDERFPMDKAAFAELDAAVGLKSTKLAAKSKKPAAEANPKKPAAKPKKPAAKPNEEGR